MYDLVSTEFFEKKLKRLTKNNILLKDKVRKIFKMLRIDPFYPSLETHKVASKNVGEAYSSSVTGDLRIVWDFAKNQTLLIILLDFGGHSGKHKVYS